MLFDFYTMYLYISCLNTEYSKTKRQDKVEVFQIKAHSVILSDISYLLSLLCSLLHFLLQSTCALVCAYLDSLHGQQMSCQLIVYTSQVSNSTSISTLDRLPNKST